MPDKTQTRSALACITSRGTFLMIRHSTPALKDTGGTRPAPLSLPIPSPFQRDREILCRQKIAAHFDQHLNHHRAFNGGFGFSLMALSIHIFS